VPSLRYQKAVLRIFASCRLCGAATGNIDFVKGLQDKGFTPYGGQQVANFSRSSSRHST
jgi:hypothetical protein